MSQHHIIIMKSKLDEKMLLKVLSENGSFEFALIHVHVSCLLFVRKMRYEEFFLFIFIVGIGGVSEQILQSSSKIFYVLFHIFLCWRTLNEISKYIERDNAYMNGLSSKTLSFGTSVGLGGSESLLSHNQWIIDI